MQGPLTICLVVYGWRGYGVSLSVFLMASHLVIPGFGIETKPKLIVGLGDFVIMAYSSICKVIMVVGEFFCLNKNIFVKVNSDFLYTLTSCLPISANNIHAQNRPPNF